MGNRRYGKEDFHPGAIFDRFRPANVGDHRLIRHFDAQSDASPTAQGSRGRKPTRRQTDFHSVRVYVYSSRSKLHYAVINVQSFVAGRRSMPCV